MQKATTLFRRKTEINCELRQNIIDFNWICLEIVVIKLNSQEIKRQRVSGRDKGLDKSNCGQNSKQKETDVSVKKAK